MSTDRLDQIVSTEDRQLVELVQGLVRIPSWTKPKDETVMWKQNENNVVDFLQDWLKENTDLDIQRQKLDYGRSNLIISKGKPNLVFLGHTDTVQPPSGAPYDQFAAEIHDGKIWGLGTTDMKSGLAAMVQALSLSPAAGNVWAFLYADEEYDFLGMKALVEEYSGIRPQWIISSDGSDLRFGHGCRGLMEIRARVKGLSGHAAKGNGLNAIEGVSSLLVKTRHYLNQFTHAVMGDTSLNVAYLLGGQGGKQPIFNEKGQLQAVGQEGNVIPDIAEFVIDVRPSSPELTVQGLTEFMSAFLTEQGYGFEIVEKRHELGSWYTDIEEIRTFQAVAKQATGKSAMEFEQPGKSGYIDLQMLWDKVGRPPSFTFGGGHGETAHKPDENIDVADLIKERDFFRMVLDNHAK